MRRNRDGWLGTPAWGAYTVGYTVGHVLAYDWMVPGGAYYVLQLVAKVSASGSLATRVGDLLH